MLCLLQAGCSRDSASRLIAELENPDVATRRAAVRELAEHPPPADAWLIDALAKAVGDSDEEVRRFSIRALGAVGPAAKSSVPALERALGDSDAPVRTQAALAIAAIDPKNPKFVPVLAAAMRTGDGPLLLQIGAMGERAAWAVPTLVELLSHQSPQVRALAAQTLGKVGAGSADAKAALERAARDSNATARAAAQGALTGVDPQEKQ